MVSVIVPVYNVEAYLRRCIDSILSQSYSDFELILIDDGSPDNCGEICDRYAKKDARIHVIHQENAGVSAARNAGLDIAKGNWIAFVDSDDWLHKDFLKILLSGTLADTDIVMCGSIMTANDYEPDQDYADALFRNISLRELSKDHLRFCRVWARLIRKSALRDLKFVPGTEPKEDSFFNELLYCDVMMFRVTDTELYYYYMRPDSAIHTQMARKMLNAVDPLIGELKETEDEEKRRRIISRCCKCIFSARYGEMYSEDYADVKERCRVLLDQVVKYLPELKIQERIVMQAFRVCPWLYRLWRIVGDPTLLQHEKRQKAIKRERSR